MATLLKLGTVKERLSRVEPLARTALAAACGERVSPVYDKYWVGDHFKAVTEAVNFGWTYATGGGGLDSPVDARLLEDLKYVVSYLNDEEVTILASSATVSLRIVQSVSRENDASIVAVDRAVGSALYVALMAGKYCGGDVGKLAAEKEESAWLEAALSLVEGWRGPCQRQMFDALGPKPPRWWVAYEAGETHF